MSWNFLVVDEARKEEWDLSHRPWKPGLSPMGSGKPMKVVGKTLGLAFVSVLGFCSSLICRKLKITVA